MPLFKSIQRRKKAIAYYRHSAEDKQENSVAIQREQIKKFAEKYDIEIIHEEADEGKSGLLGSEGRPGFKCLFDNWIENPNAPDFNYVLVLDESRWGRFQDLDQAGAYVHRCKKRGKEVVYLTSGFPAEGTELEGHLTTDIRRYMSAKYSAELSKKVHYGCVMVSQQGYSAGGTACYGMVRLLLDVDKKPVRILKHGEHKAISNARVTFRPANDKTTQTVKNIFLLFDKGWHIEQIVKLLTEKAIHSAKGGSWNRQKILRILTNPVYTGTRVYNKTWGRLKEKRRANPHSNWVIKENAFPAIISKKVFYRIQERLYWTTPSKWKQGIYAIKKARRSVQQELKKFLISKGISEDDIFEYLSRFPMVYAVSFYPTTSLQCWCFIIPAELRRYEFVIGIGVSPNSEDPINKTFVIPTSELGYNDISVFSENDIRYSKYKLEESQVEKKVSRIAEKLLTS